LRTEEGTLGAISSAQKILMSSLDQIVLKKKNSGMSSDGGSGKRKKRGRGERTKVEGSARTGKKYSQAWGEVLTSTHEGERAFGPFCGRWDDLQKKTNCTPGVKKKFCEMSAKSRVCRNNKVRETTK